MAFWDILRPVTNQAVAFDFFTSIIVFVLSLALFAVSILAYRRTKSRRFVFVTIAFFLFATKSALNMIDLFVSPGYFFHKAANNIFELGILVCLFLAIFKK
ncbi:MAG: hypothetical protein KAS30_00445 [Candidatus Diapherotrites archaeon]|nr:hypothetical protein [Candidatus Diapherotrites archaeon]